MKAIAAMEYSTFGAPPTSTAPPITLASLFLNKPADSLAPGEGLFWEGETASSLYKIESGIFRIFRHMVDGRRGLSGFLYPGAVLGMSFTSNYLYSAQAVTEARVRRLSRSHFQSLLSSNPILYEDSLRTVSSELSEIQDQVLMLSQKNSEERVASFLLLIAQKMGQNGAEDVEIDVPMSRADIADYLGLTVETVCRAITKLRRQKTIRLLGRRKVVLRRVSNLMIHAGDREAIGQFS